MTRFASFLLCFIFLTGCYDSEFIDGDTDFGTDEQSVLLDTDSATEQVLQQEDTETETGFTCEYPPLPDNYCIDGKVKMFQYSYVFKQHTGELEEGECDTEILTQVINCPYDCDEESPICSNTP